MISEGEAAMFRLMIADDEDEERRGIRFLLDKFGFD